LRETLGELGKFGESGLGLAISRRPQIAIWGRKRSIAAAIAPFYLIRTLIYLKPSTDDRRKLALLSHESRTIPCREGRRGRL